MAKKKPGIQVEPTGKETIERLFVSRRYDTPVKVNGKESTIRIYAMHRKDEENKKRLWFYEFSIN